MGKAKQKTFDGMEDVNGKLIDTMSITVMVPKVIDGVEVRKMDNGLYRAMKDESLADGETYAQATKKLGKQLV
jgi:DNA-binding cell septation regulator SpoVG